MEQLFSLLRRVFPAVLRMSMSAGVLVLAALMLRAVIRKAPKWVLCLVWIPVAVRLCCPVLPQAGVSLMPRPERFAAAEALLSSTADRSLPALEREKPPAAALRSGHEEGLGVRQIVVTHPHYDLSLLWALGVLLMLLYALLSFLRLRRRTAISAEAEKGVWLCDEIDSPFILGVFRPRICLPSRLEEPRRSHVLAHEKAHLRRHDHWWKPLGFLLLSLHWFNPLLWLAYFLLCRDMELACDERAVRGMDAPGRSDYAQALLDLSRSRRLISACPLAFGEAGVKKRVKSILHYRKPAFWLVAAAVLACAVLCLCFLTEQPSFLPAGEEPASGEYHAGDIRSALGPEALRELTALMEAHGKRRFPVGADDPNSLSRSVVMNYAGGGCLVVHNQYYSGFSLLRGREDDYRTIVTWFSGEGKPDRAWRMEEAFDEAFLDWENRWVPLTAPPGQDGEAPLQDGETPDLEALREEYPEYFGLSAFKGLELYVWQLGPGVLRCGLLEGTNRNKTSEEIRSLRGTTPEEMKLILSTYDIPAENIAVLPFLHPVSSYVYEIDEEYREQLRELFFTSAAAAETPPDEAAAGEKPGSGEGPLLTVTCGGVSIVPYLHHRNEQIWMEEAHGFLAGDGWPVEFDIQEYGDEIPSLILEGELTLALGENVRRSDPMLQVYDQELNRLVRQDEESFNALYELAPGDYWCTIGVCRRGRYIPEAGQYEHTAYDGIFRLVVPEK
jgi:beta-lactamase regulating signal transducer with metallopeptidase domain